MDRSTSSVVVSVTSGNSDLLLFAGEGEFGEVFKALWHGTPVAAKVLKAVGEDFALGDFRSEVQVLRRVHHPNTVHFLGACTKEPPYILVTELMSVGLKRRCFLSSPKLGAPFFIFVLV